jgi:Sec-independent protein translocase protein TatA
MEIFGIGPLELLLVLLLALIIFGPKDLEKAGRTLGRSLYKLIKSDTWRLLTNTSQKIKTLPNDLLKQAEQEVLQEKVAGGETKREDWLQDPHIHNQNPHPSGKASHTSSPVGASPKKTAKKTSAGSTTGAPKPSAKKTSASSLPAAPKKKSPPKTGQGSPVTGSKKATEPKQPSMK